MTTDDQLDIFGGLMDEVKNSDNTYPPKDITEKQIDDFFEVLEKDEPKINCPYVSWIGTEGLCTHCGTIHRRELVPTKQLNPINNDDRIHIMCLIQKKCHKCCKECSDDNCERHNNFKNGIGFPMCPEYNPDKYYELKRLVRDNSDYSKFRFLFKF